ncbi:MAG: hypothetical protein H5T86_15235, partial [Armatimonadetes bacterium]|nr:hypothetical protein [Armatimonadota bacterium]
MSDPVADEILDIAGVYARWFDHDLDDAELLVIWSWRSTIPPHPDVPEPARSVLAELDRRIDENADHMFAALERSSYPGSEPLDAW